ncbi:Ankyrin repeat protein 2 [Giardia muris]|uniref:Ankyrin repeat protein 2 n=1 Tax=Giardia muris TaxID=5742 RepID=A0A4Z1SQV8_GIAMU|nr:Ankyrin repeat protein 2 [Giardia muris]|eukprot:TNJ28080.1 Ankyrin repeat protein 2 [Giardia muris]
MEYSDLMLAAKNGDVDELERHLSAAGGCDHEGRTALMLAARNGELDCARRLARRELGIRDFNGWTALMYAVFGKAVECVRLLLNERGMQSTNTFLGYAPGTSALMLAVRLKRPDMVRILGSVEYDLVDNDGHDALWYALHHADVSGKPTTGDYAEIITILEQAASSTGADPVVEKYPLMNAVCYGTMDDIQAHLGEIRKQDSNGRTALMLAAYAGNSAAIALLIEEAGIQTTRAIAPYDVGTTALMLAAEQGHVSIVRQLREKEMWIQTEKLWTALMYASKNGHVEVVKELLDEAYLINQLNETALDIAEAIDTSSPDYEKCNQCATIIREYMKANRREQTSLKSHIVNFMTHTISPYSNLSSDALRLLSLFQRQIERKADKRKVDIQPLQEQLRELEARNADISDELERCTRRCSHYETQCSGLRLQLRDLRDINQGLSNSLTREEEQRASLARRLQTLESNLARYNYSQGRSTQNVNERNSQANSRLPDTLPLTLDDKTYSIDDLTELKERLEAGLKLVQARILQVAQKAQQENTCVICLGTRKDTVFHPCKHCCACWNCSQNLINRNCPICRRPISRVEKVFI